MSTQDQQRTNIPEGQWSPCQSVTLHDGYLNCVLAHKKTYSLMEAYEDNLHLHFAKVSSNKELMDFIRDWGPLYVPDSSASFSVSLQGCWRIQKQFSAAIDALTAFERGLGEREAFVKLIEAAGEPTLAVDLEWAKRASTAEVLTRMQGLVAYSFGPSVRCSLKLVPAIGGAKPQVEAGWHLKDLKDALRWMVWWDAYNKRPPVCCLECGGIFRPRTARFRKYCTDKCGHRATARVAMQRRRDAERAGRR